MSDDPLAQGVILRADPHACFACGDLNANGLQLKLHVATDSCWTEMEIAERFQGWEGMVHGGVISTLLDEVLSWSCIGEDLWAVTARLSVEYKKPAIVGRRLRAEGRIVERRRRVITTAGRLVDLESGDVLATAEGVHVTVNEEKKAELQARYGNLRERRLEAERELLARAAAPASPAAE